MILGLGVPELLVILLVALIIFGPKNLPKLGSAIGKTVKNVREGMEEGDDDKAVSKTEKSNPSENVEEVVAEPANAAEDVPSDEA